jgi:hypothetical protein
MNAQALEAGIIVGKYPLVTGLHYDLENLIISYDPDVPSKALEIIFHRPRGFRCLDEGDLHHLWKDRFLVENWFFEVFEGGWLDHEATRDGFLSKIVGYKEFFICGVDDCISVISNDPPLFQVIEHPQA